MAPLRGATLTPELLHQLAEALEIPLPVERAARLLPVVQGMLEFTAELDDVVTRDTLPAAVFVVEEA